MNRDVARNADPRHNRVYRFIWAVNGSSGSGSGKERLGNGVSCHRSQSQPLGTCLHSLYGLIDMHQLLGGLR
jgi:hypothetical protein